MKYLLDTNVISELNKPKCSPNVKSFIDTLSWEDLYLSVITIGEICYGTEKLSSSAKKHELSVWLYTKLPEWFSDRILEVNTEAMLEWGKIRAYSQRTLPVIDTMIAAIAIVNRMFLVTENVKDFEGIEGINLINPWEF